MVTKKIKKKLLKHWILGTKSSKNHNLQKWTPISSISNRFRDMSNSLNAHHYDMFEFWGKFRPIIRREIEFKKHWQKYTTMVTKKIKKCWLKNCILGSKTSKNHNLQKWTPISSIYNRFRDISNYLTAHNYDIIIITQYKYEFQKKI